jgi:hypothetical protein
LRTFELDEASRDAPRGSRAWALWIIGQAQLTRKELQLDAEILGSLLKQIDEFRAWEPLGLLDIETLALKELQLEPAVLRAVLGTKPGRSLGAVIAHAEAAKPISQHGGSRVNKQADNISSTQHGTEPKYLTARIARDRPDILERMKAGEYTSVRQAALDAGIIKLQSSFPIHDMNKLAAALKRRLTTDQWAELVRIITSE